MKAALAALAVLAFAAEAAAWPAQTMTAIARDGRRLLPQTLARLLGERELQIQQGVERFPPGAAASACPGSDRG